MGKKIVEFIKNGDSTQVFEYFRSKGYRDRLENFEEELLIRKCSDDAFMAYINRFSLSKVAEKVMIDLKKPELVKSYIKKYGLLDSTQKYVLDCNLYEIARILFMNCDCSDIDYLLGSRNEEMVKIYLEYHALNSDEHLLYLLSFKNLSIFCDYVAKGRVIGDVVKDRVIAIENLQVFKAVVFQYIKVLRTEAITATDFNRLKKKVAPYAFNAEQQLNVLESGDRVMIEDMLNCMPLEKEAQAYLFEHNFLKPLIQNHVVSLYCVGGYRFEKEFEEKLFKLLNKRSLDDCLISMRSWDSFTIVKFCSNEHVLNYVKTSRLSDEAQVYLVENRNDQIVEEFIIRFNKHYGMCWQAEVQLARRNCRELIEMYINIHTMCGQALQIIQRSHPELHKRYYELHNC